MAAELLGGAAIGAVFGELLKAILDAKDRAVSFKSVLNRLESTINTIRPIINDMQELKKKLDRPKEELEGLINMLNKGVERVHKYSKVAWCNPMRLHYATKLQELDDSILRFFDINIQSQIARDSVQILTHLNEMRAKMEWMMMGEPSAGFKNPIEFLDPCGVPEPPQILIGLDVPLQELKMWLFKDGEKVLVLSAPVGCGKTTLAKMLCHDKEVKGDFKDNIFFVTVSKAPNLKVIIQRLIQHMGYGVPEFQNDEDAVNQLAQLLKQKAPNPILLVLDDVWSGSESFLEKFVFQIPNYKILVTSRFVFPRFSSYKLKLMNYEDAKTLFCQSAFEQNGSSFMPDEDLINKIVRTCKGFPLALIVVGRSLCGQPEEIWKSRVMEWSEGQSIFNFEFETDLLNYLKTSLDVLDNKVLPKECFMDLGSFPEDQRIPAAALIDMWVELYKLENDVYAMAILYELSTRNLVDLIVTRKDASEVDGYYNEYFVKLHDLLRELAAYQSRQDPIEQRKRLIINISRNNIPKWFMELKQQPIGARLLSIFPVWLLPKCFMGLKRQPISARLLSISTDEMFSSNWSDLRLPEVEVIVLNLQTENYTLPKFMTKMNKLKVLIVINTGFCPVELTNFQLLASLSNLKRIRLEHISILSLSNIQLTNLNKASFKMCKIGQAFSDSTIQLPGIMPNLVELNIDYCSDLVELPASLCNIVHIKKLSITNCHKLPKLPERIGNLANLEVLRLHACTELSELPSSIGSLHKLSFLDISDCLKLWRMPEEMGELCNLRKLHMRGCSSLSELPPSIMDLRQLTDVFCDEETSSLWQTLEFSLPNLKITVIKENINLNWLHNLQF